MRSLNVHQIGMRRHVKVLKSKGFSEDQIDSVLEVLHDVLSSQISDVAKKSDIRILKEQIDKIEMRLVIKLGGIISFWASVLATLIKV